MTYLLFEITYVLLYYIIGIFLGLFQCPLLKLYQKQIWIGICSLLTTVHLRFKNPQSKWKTGTIPLLHRITWMIWLSYQNVIKELLNSLTIWASLILDTGQEAAIIWRAADFCGRQLGWRLGGSTCTGPDLCWGKSCPHLPLNWEAGVGASSGNNCGTIPPSHLHLRSESTGHVHLGQGGPDLPSSEGGGGEKAGGDEIGGADEGGEEGAVDGLSSGTRLGEKRPMPWSVKKKSN